jgi:hypothetical protein
LAPIGLQSVHVKHQIFGIECEVFTDPQSKTPLLSPLISLIPKENEKENSDEKQNANKCDLRELA